MRLYNSLRIIGRASLIRFREMTSDELRLPAGEFRGRLEEELPRNILRRWNRVGERGVVFVEKLVVEPIMQNPADALLNFADVHQHPGCRIYRTGEHKIND